MTPSCFSLLGFRHARLRWGPKLGEVEKKVKERQERTGKSQACWLGPASSWDGSQIMFAAGNLTELSKQSNILLERKGVAATEVLCSNLPAGEPSHGAQLTDSIQVLHL